MIAIAAASIGIASVIGAGTVAAQTATQTSLADKIATKFNVNKDDVQQVIDQDHQERHAEMEQRMEERLQAAVDAGKLTSDQKAKILAKHDEMEKEREANREAMENKTPEERRAAIEQKRTELEQWAKDNGIPTEYLMRGPGGGKMGHHGMMRGDGPSSPEAEVN